ncbi:MAG: GntR family transcriptional regulator, partial [Halanaerobiales bacterium]
MEIIKKDSPIPSYYQIYQYLRQLIEYNDEYQAGDQLPSERALADKMDVSRMTVRKALKQLSKEGLIYSQKGKGNFISKNKINYEVKKDTSFSKTILEMGLNPGAEILSCSKYAADKILIDVLKVTGEEMIWGLDILRYVDNTPVSLTRSYIPVNKTPDLNKYMSEEVSLYKLVERKYSIKPTRGESLCEVKLADW